MLRYVLLIAALYGWCMGPVCARIPPPIEQSTDETNAYVAVACFKQSDMTTIVRRGAEEPETSANLQSLIGGYIGNGQCVPTVFTDPDAFMNTPLDADSVRAYEAYPYTDVRQLSKEKAFDTVTVRFIRRDRPLKQIMYFNGRLQIK